MGQYQKDEVREAIASAALRVFAEKGYRGAAMADIGRLAGVSTGNIYRYFEDKAELFREVIPGAWVKKLVGLLRSRVLSLEGVSDIRSLGADAPFHVISEDLLRFCIEHRLRVVVVLSKSEGTPYEGVAAELVRALTRLAIAHFRGLDPSLRVGAGIGFTLEEAYRHLVVAMVDILAGTEDEKRIRDAVHAYSRYHLAGLKALFE